MKNIFIKTCLLLLFTVAFLTSCEEDEVPPDIPGTDQPPTAPVLLLPADSTLNVDYRGLNLSWEPGIDPEGGPVTHHVYLDTDEIGIYLGEHTSATDIDVDFSLYPHKDYHWFVGAEDSVGNQTMSEVFHFKTRELIYTAHTMQDQMGDFYDNAMVVFNGKLWSVGGYNSYTPIPNGTNDVWSSDNGINWVSHQPAPFLPRKGHTLSVFDGKMWVIGGMDNSSPGVSLGDVWYTSDGQNWIQASPTGAIFAGVSYHNTLVFNNKMFVIGSSGIWSTPNGFDWVQESVNPFGSDVMRYSTAVVYNNALYVMGGGSPDLSNKIFKSPDGSSWEELSPIQKFTPRRKHTALVYDGKIWILGGLVIDDSGNIVHADEVWYSDDPDQFWYLYDGPPLFSGRISHCSLVYNDEIWLFGGMIYTGPTGEISSFH